MAVTTIPWKRLRTAANKLTTPLHPDDYLRLVNPLWSERELRGRVEEVIPETDDAATLVIRPGWGWHYNHRPGQYVGIAVQVDGKFQWRSYSVSSPPQRKGRNISITVRAMPEGLLSAHLVKRPRPGHDRAAGAARGRLRAARPAAGADALPGRRQRDHPGDGDAAHARPAQAPCPTSSCTTPRRPRDRMIFRDELNDAQRAARRRSPCTTCTPTSTGCSTSGRPRRPLQDWRERETWACGPGPMLDAISEHFEDGRPRGPAAHRAVLAGARRRRRRGRHDHVPQLQQDRRGRRRHHGPRGRRGRPGSACPTAAGWASATPARSRSSPGRSRDLRNGDARVRPARTSPSPRPVSPRPSATARSTSERRPISTHLLRNPLDQRKEPPAGHLGRQGVRPPQRGGGRAARPRARRDPRRHRGSRAMTATRPTSTALSRSSAGWAAAGGACGAKDLRPREQSPDGPAGRRCAAPARPRPQDPREHGDQPLTSCTASGTG